MKNRIEIFVLILASVTNFLSLLFVSDIDYRQFFTFCMNYRYQFVFTFKQHRVPTLEFGLCKDIAIFGMLHKHERKINFD